MRGSTPSDCEPDIVLQEFHPKNKDLIVNVNGRLVHRNEAGVSPFDSVVQGGDAVWEGLRVYEGKILPKFSRVVRKRYACDGSKAVVVANRRLVAASGQAWAPKS